MSSKDHLEMTAPGTAEPLSDLPLHCKAKIVSIGGDRAFRRRLMELGLVPGTTISVENIAPMGDPLELSVRGCRLSIRRGEAKVLLVTRDSTYDFGEK